MRGQPPWKETLACGGIGFRLFRYLDRMLAAPDALAPASPDRRYRLLPIQVSSALAVAVRLL